MKGTLLIVIHATCSEDTSTSGISSLVFRHLPGQGERYVVTRDLDVGPMSILQFDVSYRKLV